MDKLELKALGKINLGLDVLGRRENGYHDVRMVMQTLYLYDNVTLQKKSAPGIEIDSNLFYLPNDESSRVPPAWRTRFVKHSWAAASTSCALSVPS